MICLGNFWSNNIIVLCYMDSIQHYHIYTLKDFDSIQRHDQKAYLLLAEC